MSEFRDQLKADMDASKELWRRARNRELFSKPDIECAVVDAFEIEIARLREALHQCAEYFADRSDVDTSDGEPVANKEMRLLGVVKAALGEK